MCAELEAANVKGNSRQVFQIVKSMTQKFQPCMQCMQCIQSAEMGTRVRDSDSSRYFWDLRLACNDLRLDLKDLRLGDLELEAW